MAERQTESLTTLGSHTAFPDRLSFPTTVSRRLAISESVLSDFNGLRSHSRVIPLFLTPPEHGAFNRNRHGGEAIQRTLGALRSLDCVASLAMMATAERAML
jgi:hypothetical protein